MNMLDEEATEFKEAFCDYLAASDTLFADEFILDSAVNMVDAYCDWMFVYMGTVCKGIHGSPDDHGHWQSIMNSILTELLATHGVTLHTADGRPPLVERCFLHVIDANEAKPMDKVTGKVVKGPNWSDPKVLIRNELLEAGFLSDKNKALERYKASIAEKMRPKVIDVKDLPSEDEGDK
jgi:hypothetical protein